MIGVWKTVIHHRLLLSLFVPTLALFGLNVWLLAHHSSTSILRSQPLSVSNSVPPKIRRLVGDVQPEDEEKIMSRSSSSTALDYGTLERPFAETMPEFKLHLMRAVQNQKKRYSQQDIELIAKASRIAIDLFSTAWRLSGKRGMNHYIGTASCMLALHAPAKFVVLAMVHGIYYSFWAENVIGESSHPFFYLNDICARRRWLVMQLGSDMEYILWRYYTLHSGKPNPEDPQFWLHLLPKNNVLDDIDKNIIAFNICDELEQYQSYEQLWVDNDRNRTDTWQLDFLRTIDLLDADPALDGLTFGPIRSIAKLAFQNTNDLYNEDKRGGFEMEFKAIFESVFRSAGHIPFIDWSHHPEVVFHTMHCHADLSCIENWNKIRGWWDSHCCEHGGPCPEHSTFKPDDIGTEERRTLFLPINQTLSPNRVMLECLEGRCDGVMKGKPPVLSYDPTKSKLLLFIEELNSGGFGSVRAKDSSKK